MALHLEANAITNQDADSAATTSAATAATNGRSGKNATPANNHGDDQPPMKTAAAIAEDVDEDELFELDIALLDGRSGDGHGHHRRHRNSSAAAVADDGGGHALLANCLLPVQSVSSAVPVPPASSVLSLYHPYSGYYSSRRLIFTGGGGDSRSRFLGRSTGSSARFCFSSRGFETSMGSYFQRY